MDVFARLFVKLSEWCRPYAVEIAMAMAATTLAVFGDLISDKVRRTLANRNFFLRLAVFVFLCAFGYGVLSLLLARLLASGLSRLGGMWLFLTVSTFFLLIGLAAERRRKI